MLESLARSYTLPYWQVARAQMVLMAADGLRNDQIAARLRCGRDVISQWRKRFFEQPSPASRTENDDLRWPHRDGLIWPHFSSVVVDVDVA